MSTSLSRQPLTDAEMEIAFREGATDEEIELKLRDLMLWSYMMRDPLGFVVGQGGQVAANVSAQRGEAR